MQNPNRLWFLLNWQAWIVLLMGAAATVVVSFITRSNQGWLITLGVIGYLLVLLLDIIGGGSLGRSAHVRLAHAEQENRELRAEQARLAGGVNELQAKQEELMKALAEARAEVDKLKAQSKG
jgi:peptidoglycan hydrolase CwlO-like protein